MIGLSLSAANEGVDNSVWMVSFDLIRDVKPADTILFAKTVQLQKTTVFLWYAKHVSIFAEGVCVNNNYIKKNHCLNNNKSLK